MGIFDQHDHVRRLQWLHHTVPLLIRPAPSRLAFSSRSFFHSLRDGGIALPRIRRGDEGEKGLMTGTGHMNRHDRSVHRSGKQDMLSCCERGKGVVKAKRGG